jgi:hypothetical protein
MPTAVIVPTGSRIEIVRIADPALTRTIQTIVTDRSSATMHTFDWHGTDWTALVIDGHRGYALVPTALTSRPEVTQALAQALEKVRAAIARAAAEEGGPQ